MLVNGERTTLNVKERNSNNVNVMRQTEYLVEKFKKIGCNDADRCYFFFKKCFTNLSEDTIWSIFEVATHNTAVRSPIKYFIGACRNQMAMK